MELTEAQSQAVYHRASRNLQLIACAGSGKTEVVALRVVELLRESVPPAGIIAFTFTEKAAAELKDRIVRRTREALGDVHGLADMFVGTIHAFCLDLLKTEVPEFLKFEVFNEVQGSLFVDRHSAQSGLTRCTDCSGNALRRYLDTGLYVTALSILREAKTDPVHLGSCSLCEGLDIYRALLRGKAYLDYSGILDHAVQVLTEDAPLRERLAARIQHVVVDEYQDLNPIQERIVRLLHDLGAHLCVVGDDDQTIYQWRGSDVRNILDFESRYPDVTSIRLQENFRSSRGIVETARGFIEQNAERLPKSMIPTDAQATEPGDIVALSFDSADEEAAYVASIIASLRGVAFGEGDEKRGLAWSDMAVLLRSVRKCAEPITKALDQAKIPYVVRGMNRLFTTAEAQAARLLFYLAAGKDGTHEATVLEAWELARTGAPHLAAAVRYVAKARELIQDPDGKRHSVYNIQRLFLDFLEQAGIREERVPEGRGEVLFYNLGRFSQLISDFETIHFHSRPPDKYQSFAKFLEYGAEEAYPEGWQDNAYVSPDAVQVMTVHQAKGMQWPVVFVPALLRNRFPSKKQGGRNVWHLIPKKGIHGQARFEGTVDDERRLFYVAMTRSQKFLHLTWAPVPGNRLYQAKSDFWEFVLRYAAVKRRHPDYSGRPRLDPKPRSSVANVVFSFSDLKYFFECPYQFKLRILYGFNPPLDEALGYGKSLHDALAEVHARAMRGDIVPVSEVERLVDTHLRAPFAYTQLRESLRDAARRVVRNYLVDNGDLLRKVEFSEKGIEINLGEGISVVGRIDLVRRLDTGETTIIDLKSTDRAQPEEVTETQLHIYVLGYEELTGRLADNVEIYELEQRKAKPRAVDSDFLQEVRGKVQGAARDLRSGCLAAMPSARKCPKCDYLRMCGKAVQV